MQEAYVVVFRRRGPRYVLPTVLRAEDYRVHLVLVDIASPAQSGARQRQRPVLLNADEFFAARDDLEAADTANGATRA